MTDELEIEKTMIVAVDNKGGKEIIRRSLVLHGTQESIDSQYQKYLDKINALNLDRKGMRIGGVRAWIDEDGE